MRNSIESLSNCGRANQCELIIEDESDDPNFLSYKSLEKELRKKYLGEYVAFVGGEFVGHDPNRDQLIETVHQQFHTFDMLIQKVEETPKVVRFRHPFCIEVSLVSNDN